MPLPATGDDLSPGLWAGRVGDDPALLLPRGGGRLRRWSYAAAAEGPTTLGVAIVDLGILATAFAFLRHEGDTWTWDHKSPLRRGAGLAHTSREVSTYAAGKARIQVGGNGSIRLDVAMPDGPRVRARLDAGSPGGDVPAVLRTSTAGGGWNVTEKSAGYPVRGVIEADGEALPFGLAGGWRDWTTGRQDRRTTWRWAAGAGRGANGARVGLNVSTGMNDLEAGENVVWWGGTPWGLALEVLEPAGRARDGDWRLAGPGWHLDFETCGVRAASENVGVLRSVYTQPIGTFRGTLPGPDGEPVEVELEGVTEDHVAVW
ncbi:MAG: DUF2804 family protein [Nitriliruptorales bacterium]|nr:DUF2804 family protein [Nitriliruptorales bacterium]